MPTLPLTDEPRDLLLDSTNNLVFPLQWSRGLTAVMQSCRIAVQMFLDEWFLDLDAGIPYWNGILGSKPEIAKANARVHVRRALSGVDGVLKITLLNVDYDGATRGLTIRWRVLTGTGETPVDTIALKVGG